MDHLAEVKEFSVHLATLSVKLLKDLKLEECNLFMNAKPVNEKLIVWLHFNCKT